MTLSNLPLKMLFFVIETHLFPFRLKAIANFNKKLNFISEILVYFLEELFINFKLYIKGVVL